MYTLLANVVLTQEIWAALFGALGGVASMLLYARLSPQQKLLSLNQQKANLHQLLADYDGDFAGALALSKQNLYVAIQSVRYVLGPSLLAGLPVIAALFWVGDRYVPFFIGTFIAALITKFAFRIA